MNDCTIIVNSCDAYNDTWELFFKSLKFNWPNLEYKIVLNTEKDTYEDTNFVSTHNVDFKGKPDKWGFRLKKTLESVTTQNVIMLYDDFILEDVVNYEQITKCSNYLIDNPEIAVFYFIGNDSLNIDDKRFEKFELLQKRADYKLNSAPAIWNRRKLLNYIEEDDTPWAWEFFGSYRAYNNSDLFYSIKKEFENIYPYNYTMGGAIYRGKWVGKVVVPLIKKHEIDLDIKQRGIADGLNQDNKRSLKWKIDFFILGFKMIGFGVFTYVYRVLQKKMGFKNNV